MRDEGGAVLCVRASTSAVKESPALARNKHTRRGTMSFVHHLVSFSCNCNRESDIWACASHCSASKGHRWYELTALTSSLSERHVKHCRSFPMLLVGSLQMLLCCRCGHKGPAPVTNSKIPVVLLTLFCSLSSALPAEMTRGIISEVNKFALCGTTSPPVVSQQGQPHFSGNS